MQAVDGNSHVTHAGNVFVLKIRIDKADRGSYFEGQAQMKIVNFKFFVAFWQSVYSLHSSEVR